MRKLRVTNAQGHRAKEELGPELEPKFSANKYHALPLCHAVIFMATSKNREVA